MAQDVNVQNEVKVTGGCLTEIAAIAIIAGMMSMCGHNVQESANQEKMIQLKQQQLEVAKKQYALDSLRYYNPQKHR